MAGFSKNKTGPRCYVCMYPHGSCVVLNARYFPWLRLTTVHLDLESDVMLKNLKVMGCPIRISGRTATYDFILHIATHSYIHTFKVRADHFQLPKMVQPDHFQLAKKGPARPFFIQNWSGRSVYTRTTFFCDSPAITILTYHKNSSQLASYNYS